MEHLVLLCFLVFFMSSYTFVFCMFLSLSMRTLETQIEKGRVKRLQARSAGETLTGILVSPGMWLLLLLFIVRVLY